MKKSEVNSPRSSQIPIPIKVDKINSNYQFLEIQKNNLIVNAYEPLNSSVVSDTLNQLVVGATVMKFSPNKIVLNSINDTIKLNLRFSENWRLIGKGNLTEKNGLIKIENTSGTVTLNYNNKHSKTGFLLSILSIPFLLLIRIFSKKIRV